MRTLKAPPSSNKTRRALTGGSILLMHYGQSNADIHHAGPAHKGAFFKSDKVVVPNDRTGFRGWMGEQPLETITGFRANSTSGGIDIQSIGISAGNAAVRLLGDQAPEKFIVRSEAKGGRRFIGDEYQDGIYLDQFGDASPTYRNLISSTTQIFNAAQQEGYPVHRMYIHFAHQESDRGDSSDAYLAKLYNFTLEVERDLAGLSVPITWLLSQAGGTSAVGNGNAWQNRLALVRMEKRKDNVHVIMPRYHLQLADSVHMNAEAKILAGELIGHAISEFEMGHEFYAARIDNIERRPGALVANFRSQNPLILDDTHHKIDIGMYGFSLHGCPSARINSVILSGDRQVTLKLDGDLPDHPIRVRYAFHNNTVKSEGDGSVCGAGGLREDWEKPSQGLPGAPLHKWVLGFEYSC